MSQPCTLVSELQPITAAFFCQAIVKGLGISVMSPYFQGDISEIITAIKIQIRFQTWHEQPRWGSNIFKVNLYRKS